MDETCECIIVDDGSNDDFVNSLREYELQLVTDNPKLNIVFIYEKHNGPSKARNIGLKYARGEYIAFQDSDDEISPEFIKLFSKVFEESIDWYIFSIEAIKEFGSKRESEKWLLEDKVYQSSIDFADRYVINRHLLLYSQCNKIYKKKILSELEICFDENIDFGEDRLINFAYLMHVGRIKTSNIVMFTYYIRYDESAITYPSMSNRYINNYFDKVMYLHKKKIECINSLSKNTTDKEKHSFEQYDLRSEIEKAVERFDRNTEEEKENIDKINEIIFGHDRILQNKADIVIVLGSSRCKYRIEKAFEYYGNNKDTIFILSGGNMYDNLDITEAEYMKQYLLEKGIINDNIIVENTSVSTEENLYNVSKIIFEHEKQWKTKKEQIVIITAGFHVLRVESIVKEQQYFTNYEVNYLPAYGSNTRKDNWYKNELGKEIIYNELESR